MRLPLFLLSSAEGSTRVIVEMDGGVILTLGQLYPKITNPKAGAISKPD
jgi:hypothetical protein